ncbi:MAG: threonylcarbamoyl-AMP synthase [Candidatus Micrarchaeota archaeon]|nr:threonylcarbamoyl-AMP synthase [Candidatus Micrarchaeota archaeon]MDE1848268.1 threonylcarbamoyl-AMP synthase [Candidatus Micrarchaeota archaeon]MDE1864740.1 threonylcarbamoyl-AMP synthase [Candidatus Micrarchaeota archaeon]
MRNLKTKILKINPESIDTRKIKQASQFIKNGKLVVFPTETVYGIGASVLDQKACERIFIAKGRPSDNPLIVHVASVEMAEQIAQIPQRYVKTIRRIWPSPITFIVKAKPSLPSAVTAGLGTVALRMPSHPVALSLLKHSGVPIAAPSANPSKKPSATTGAQAKRYFNGKVECIIDSGKSPFGLESSIIDLSSFTLLRPGPFTVEEIKRIFKKAPKVTNVTKGTSSASRIISPGTKYAHYSPDTKLYLFKGPMSSLKHRLSKFDSTEFAFIGSDEGCALARRFLGCRTIRLGSRIDYYQISRNLYKSFSSLDGMGKRFGIIESFKENGMGLALMNRIRKACDNKSI